jgi:hypothetical protein
VGGHSGGGALVYPLRQKNMIMMIIAEDTYEIYGRW